MRTLARSMRTLFFAITGVAVWLLVMTCPLSAQTTQVLSDGDLYENARKAGAQKDYHVAMVYIYAYIQRNGADMKQDNEHRTTVLGFYQKVRDIASAEPGLRYTFSAPGDLPAKAKAAPAEPGYPLVCRGGGNLHFTYSNVSWKPQILIMFERGTAGVGMNRENLRSLAPGQCTWLDRAVSPQEPDTLVLAEPVFEGSSFSAQWQRGQVTGISAELYYINALQRQDGTQTFRAYNDRQGRFIVTKIE